MNHRYVRCNGKYCNQEEPVKDTAKYTVSVSSVEYCACSTTTLPQKNNAATFTSNKFPDTYNDYRESFKRKYFAEKGKKTNSKNTSTMVFSVGPSTNNTRLQNRNFSNRNRQNQNNVQAIFHKEPASIQTNARGIKNNANQKVDSSTQFKVPRGKPDDGKIRDIMLSKEDSIRLRNASNMSGVAKKTASVTKTKFANKGECKRFPQCELQQKAFLLNKSQTSIKSNNRKPNYKQVAEPLNKEPVCPGSECYGKVNKCIQFSISHIKQTNTNKQTYCKSIGSSTKGIGPYRSASSLNKKSTGYSSTDLDKNKSKVYDKLNRRCLNTSCFKKAIKAFVKEAIEESLRESVPTRDKHDPKVSTKDSVIPLFERSKSNQKATEVQSSNLLHDTNTCGCMCVCNPQLEKLPIKNKTEISLNVNVHSEPMVSKIDSETSQDFQEQYSNQLVAPDCHCCQRLPKSQANLCRPTNLQGLEYSSHGLYKEVSFLDGTKNNLNYEQAKWGMFQNAPDDQVEPLPDEGSQTEKEVIYEEDNYILQRGEFQSFLMKRPRAMDLPLVTEEELTLINEYERTVPHSSVTIMDNSEKYKYLLEDMDTIKQEQELQEKFPVESEDTLDYTLLKQERPPAKKRASIAPEDASEEYHRLKSIGDEEKRIIEKVKSEHEKKLLESLKANEEKEIAVTEVNWMHPSEKSLVAHLDTSDSLDHEVADIQEQKQRRIGETSNMFESVVKEEKNKIRRNTVTHSPHRRSMISEAEQDKGREKGKNKFLNFFKCWKSSPKPENGRVSLKPESKTVTLLNDNEDDISESTSETSVEEYDNKGGTRERRTSLNAYKTRVAPSGNFRQYVQKLP